MSRAAATADAAPGPAAPTVGGLAALAAAGALARAIHLRDGLFHGPAFPWLGVAVVLGVALLAAPAATRERPVSTRAFLALAAAILAVQFAGLFRNPIGSATAHARGLTTPPWIYAALGAGAVGAAGALVARRGGRWFALAVLAAGVVGAWMIVSVPEPHIDVWRFQQAGCEAFLRGESPYATSIEDLYGDPTGYGPGLVRDGRVLVGFQYPPVVFWADLAAYVVAGDYRFAQLAAWLAAAALFAAAAPDRVGRAAALVLLFTPRAFFVLESGWPEPVVIALLAGVAAAARRAPRLLPWVLGAFAASRQYLVFAVPAALALLPGRDAGRGARLRFLAAATAAAILPTAPFALWDYDAFAKCLWQVQAAMPPRKDALSFLALAASENGGVFPPAAIGFVLAGAAVLVARLRRLGGFAGFATTLAAAYVLFFAGGKFAFCNYYASVLAAFVGAASSTRSRPEALPR